MLPVIDLRLADYCRVAFNYCLGLSLPIGRSLWFDWEEIREAGKGLNLNLDEYLTALLSFFSPQESPGSRVLTFYVTIPGRLALCLCSLEPLNFLQPPEVCLSLPRCLDRRHDFIPQTAAPFLLYESGAFYRLHPRSQPDRTSFYVWDFGDYRGNFLKEVDKKFFFRVMNDKDSYFEYAIVPKNPCTSISFRGTIIPVHHVFCQVT